MSFLAHRPWRRAWVPIWQFAVLCALAREPLVIFGPHFDASRILTNDATAHFTSEALRVETGTTQSWPGVTLRAPEEGWNLSEFGYLAVTLRNSGRQTISVNCRVDNPGADGTRNCLTESLNLPPGKESILRVRLQRFGDSTLGGKLFGMRGYPKATGVERTIDPSRVSQLLLFLNKPTQPQGFDVFKIQAEGEFVPPAALVTDAEPFIPFIDTFGQYRHRDWPGKVHSVGELKARALAEAAELTARPGPSDWDQYGGWKDGPLLRATGFFRTEKREGKWWLVDPEGRLFWSHGIDCVRMLDATVVKDREPWFEQFPGSQNEFSEFTSKSPVLKGHYAGLSPESFSFAAANLKRKHGPTWIKNANDLAHRRLRSWGLNTIGNWSDSTVRFLRRTPYVDAIGSGQARRIEGSEGYWGRFVDPFDVSFKESLRKNMAALRGKSAGDPWCIGFFSDNEIAWGDELSLALAALRSPADQPAKNAFISDLKSNYGEIDQLNKAWATSYASWDELRESRTAPDRQRAQGDLEKFYTRIADAYFSAARSAIKEVAPHQLYLGCRFAWVNGRAAAAAAKYCDVVSYNLYQRSVADFHFNGGADVPLLIGEFHFGALDRGLFHTGLVPTASQTERAQAYRDYVAGALQHPQFVGCHWFQYQDEPTTGRVYDEENYQIGFVDIADTPYTEIVAASRAIGSELYTARSAAGVAEKLDNVVLSSPDENVRVEIASDQENNLTFAVESNGIRRAEPARLGLVTDGLDCGAAVQLGTPRVRKLNETFAWRGNKTLATNACVVAEVPIHSRAGTQEWTLEVRVFDDGVAFRYRVPNSGVHRVNGESTAWQIPEGARLWFQTNTINYEGVYQSANAHSLPSTTGFHIGPPMTIEYTDGTFGLISEAGLYHYSGMTLRPEGKGKFQTVFEDDPSGWTSEGAIVSPWRLLILAHDLNTLVNSDVIPALCEPPDKTLFPDGINTAWIRPGKAPCTWMVFGNDGAQWHRQKWFVDTAAAMGCEYLLVDAGWRTEKWGWLKDGGDLWSRVAELCRYASDRKVGIFLWHAFPEGRDDGPGLTTITARDELFSQCEKAGVKGIKIDFFDSESKATVDAYEDLLRRSAQHRLMIDFHGANKPTGEARTWPHEVTREGIREQEYLLWNSLPLTHYGALPFTRLAAGHGDFLPGYIQARFLKNTTVMFQMASAVVFSSPFLCWPDNPEAYLNSPLLEFVRTLPVTWDETRILPGSAIGSRVLLARRKATDWYVAVLNCGVEPSSQSVDISSLMSNTQLLTVYRDGPATGALEISTDLALPSDGILHLNLAPGGGVVAHISPPRKFNGWK